MKYFIIALLVTNSLNAMRFGEPEAEATAAAIKNVVATKPAHQPEAKTSPPSDSTTPKSKEIKSKL